MDKRQKLMTEAIHLFSTKGFHQTSVQEIAHGAGISKGAFYKHFHSKEQLFFEILKFYQAEGARAMAAVSEFEELPEREVFIKVLEIQIEKTLSNKEFFLMAFLDYPKDFLKESEQLLKEIQSAQIALYEKKLLALYGPDIAPYLTDLLTIFEGMLNGYFIKVIFQQLHIDAAKLARTLVASMDAIVQNLDRLEPVLTAPAVSPSPSELLFEAVEAKIKDFQQPENCAEALSLLKQETEKNEPQRFLLEALFVYLKQESRLNPEIGQLERIILEGV